MSTTFISRRDFLGKAAFVGLAAASAGVLGACSGESRDAGSSSQAEDAGSATEATSESSASASSSAAQEAAGTAATADGALVAAFSWSGNTWQVAERIAADTGATLFRIEPAEAYSTDYDTVVDAARAEQDSDARPAMASDVPSADWDSYSTIYLGYPVWWYDAPQIAKTFCDAHDFAGKTVVPFCTSGGSDLSTTLDSIQAACAGATFAEGITLSGSTVSSHLDEVDAWVSGLGL